MPENREIGLDRTPPSSLARKNGVQNSRNRGACRQSEVVNFGVFGRITGLSLFLVGWLLLYLVAIPKKLLDIVGYRAWISNIFLISPPFALCARKV